MGVEKGAEAASAAVALRNARLLRAKGMAHCEEEGHKLKGFLMCRGAGALPEGRFGSEKSTVSKPLNLMFQTATSSASGCGSDIS